MILRESEEKSEYADVMDIPVGSYVSEGIKDAINLAKERNRFILVEGNGVHVLVGHESDFDIIHREYQRALYGCTNGPVIPYPKAELTPEELESDNRFLEAVRKYWEDQHIENKRKEEEQRSSLQVKLNMAPPIELKDEEKWKEICETNSHNDYSHRCITYAEDWARLMQLEIAQGKTVAEVASKASEEADHDGITGFMFSAACWTLIQCWKYGEELRVWKTENPFG